MAAVLHSRLSAGERFDEWRRIRMGGARVVIGARSAVFAPVDNLGILIVDEEHEGSYLSEHTPAYDAREVAFSRANREGAALLLASATPSVLSFARAARGDMMLLEMASRVHDRPMPEVTLVDMREELRLGNKGIFSDALVRGLTDCLDQGQQAMLFLNRRGYAPSVMCRKCGHTMGSPACDVSLTYHAQDRSLHCHYCGLIEPVPRACPACGSAYIRTVGIGTQRVEEEVAKLFPGVPLVRMDNDTTQGKDGHRKLLNQFRSGQARVMVGTQMIAKGLDFPQVTLVGAVLADVSVNLPDYRSPERTFQLLTQMAGRAGRADLPGQVIIQTYRPEHYAIAAAAQQDYRSFYEMEFARRRRDLYPPFTMMVRLLCQARDEAVARAVSGQLLEHINELFVKEPQLRRRMLFIREDDAPIKRLMGRARAQVLMKLLVHKDSDRIIAHLNDLSRRSWSCDVVLEIDPASMA
ncbi:MAG: primosomal protein N' [Clostridiales bacterium]|nr:primosomal protein N' [Clostridiales bacterium]